MPTTSRDKKREQFLAESSRSRTPWIIVAALVAVAAMAAVVIVLTSGDKTTSVAAEPAPKTSSATAADDQAATAGAAVTLPVAKITAKAHFYSADMGGTQVAFFVAKAADGTVRSAFDACQVCYAQKKGYRQEGDAVVCNNCGRSFPIARVGLEQGGCNPVPLKGAVADGKLVFAADDLATGTPLFQ